VVDRQRSEKVRASSAPPESVRARSDSVRSTFEPPRRDCRSSAIRCQAAKRLTRKGIRPSKDLSVRTYPKPLPMGSEVFTAKPSST